MLKNSGTLKHAVGKKQKQCKLRSCVDAKPVLSENLRMKQDSGALSEERRPPEELRGPVFRFCGMFAEDICTHLPSFRQNDAYLAAHGQAELAISPILYFRMSFTFLLGCAYPVVTRMSRGRSAPSAARLHLPSSFGRSSSHYNHYKCLQRFSYSLDPIKGLRFCVNAALSSAENLDYRVLPLPGPAGQKVTCA